LLLLLSRPFNGLDSQVLLHVIFLKYNHTFDFMEHVSMFQTSSSAIVCVTLNFLQYNVIIIIVIILLLLLFYTMFLI